MEATFEGMKHAWTKGM